MTTCEHECSIPKTLSIFMIDLVKNEAHNKISFYLSINLWVYSMKVQVRALVDSGATTTFINKSVVESNNLAKEKLAKSFHVTNADGTENQGGTITHFTWEIKT